MTAKAMPEPQVFPPGSPEPPADVYVLVDEKHHAWDCADRATHIWRRSGQRFGHPEPEPRRTWAELNGKQTLTEPR